MKGTISIVGQVADEAAATATDRNDKEVIFRNCAPFTDCISEINNS